MLGIQDPSSHWFSTVAEGGFVIHKFIRIPGGLGYVTDYQNDTAFKAVQQLRVEYLLYMGTVLSSAGTTE